ncbi:MAG: integral rane sensor signal transduction histidine kinase [Acidimicrobiia bacterium]|nr:integral rane sensor signal transduction histidine kinase [Acidimicrobiia bacterium]
MIAAAQDSAVRRRGQDRWRVFAGIFLIYLGYAVQDLFAHHGPAAVVGGLVVMAVFVAAYMVYAPRGLWGGDQRVARWLPPFLVGLTVLYAFIGGRGSMSFVTYLAVTVILLWPPWLSAPTAALLVAVSAVVPQHISSWDVQGIQWAVAFPTALVSIAMYGLRGGFRGQIALYAARQEVEQMAAEQERLRIARDLHDLLGHALTTMALKADLAARLVRVDPDRAQAEMEAVAQLTRRSLADVRAAVSGYREVGLATELATAREVLRAAGIEADLPPAADEVTGDLRELFGWVVREGVTNAVRHSNATEVRVRLGPSWIEVADNGGGHPTAAQGNGLLGLRERVAAVGGRVNAGDHDSGGWSLRVDVPTPS